MKKIRITEAQFKAIQEAEKSNIKNIKITESQYKKIQEALKAGPIEQGLNKEISKNLDESMLTEGVDFVEFGKAVIQAIQFFFTDPGQNGLSPFWVKNGLSAGDVRTLIAGSGLIATAMGVGGEPTYKIVRKGFINGLKRLYNAFIERRYDMYNKGKVIDKQATHVNNGEIEENFPPGVNPGTSDAPWNRPDAPMQTSSGEFQVMKNFGDFAIVVDGMGNKYFLDVTNFRHNTENDDELGHELNNALDSGELKLDSTGEQLFGMNMVSKITPQNIETLLGQDENPELYALLNDMSEATTTGSVGGSYETPQIWAKNPKNSRFSKEPMIKGGKMIRRKLSEIEQVNGVRYIVEMDMYLTGKDEDDVKLQIVEIENHINKRYDGRARATNVKELKFGSMKEGEENIEDNVEE